MLSGRFDSSDKFGKKVSFPNPIDRIEIKLGDGIPVVWNPDLALIQSEKPDEPREIDYWFKDREYIKKVTGCQLNIIKDVTGKFLYTNFHYPYGIYSTCQTTFDRPKCQNCNNTRFQENSSFIVVEGFFCHGENQVLLRINMPFKIKVIFKNPKPLNNSLAYYLTK